MLSENTRTVYTGIEEWNSEMSQYEETRIAADSC